MRSADAPAALGFTLTQTQGAGFVHATYQKPVSEVGPVGAPSDTVYVYFEGDGRPWNNLGTEPSPSPDPTRPLALELAAMQQGRVHVLERPCYYGHTTDPGCEPALWTSDRFSETVVASMAAALRQVALQDKASAIVIIGYSGGGPLALLTADRLLDVKAVVTVAANLDIDAWVRHHGYLPLSGSLDPLTTRALAPGCEIHIAAQQDSVVPLAQTQLAVARRPGAVMWIEPDADHACCWKKRWPRLMEQIRRQIESAHCIERFDHSAEQAARR